MIHERLIARFGELAGGGVLHLASAPDHVEDRGTVAYLEDCARQGGFETEFIALADIGLTRAGQFVDLRDRPIHRLFKLYPWEWIFAEPAMQGLLKSRTAFLEPPWKAILSSKGMLAALWQLAPGHPNLLETYFESDPEAARLGQSYARKPLFSREGANVTLVSHGAVVDQDDGPYGSEGHIRQRLAKPAHAHGNTCVVGSWIVAGEAAGIGFREDKSPITKNTSRFVPHAIVG